MKLLSILLIVTHIILNTVTAAAAATSGALDPLEFTCPTGALPSTEEDWRRVCGGMLEPEAKPASLGSGAIHRHLSREERETVTETDNKSEIYKFMTPAKNQGGVGSCTAFAIAACIEYLVPGLTVSEAELFLRIRLLGKLGRSDNGIGLHSYVTLLREGVVRSEDFIPYDDFSAYAELRDMRASPEYKEDLDYYLDTKKFRMRRKKEAEAYPLDEEKGTENLVLKAGFAPFIKKSEVLAASDDFKESVEDILRDRGLPSTALVSPTWRVKPFHVKYRGVVHCEVREGYWRDQIFNCFPLKIRPKAGEDMSPDILNYFKHILNSVPIVVTVPVFDKLMWHYPIVSMANNYTINIPSPEPSGKKNYHAICLCGYDNSIAVTGGKGAFRIKNSWWGSAWADKGFAWLSYDYVKKYIGSAMVILTHPTEMFIDMDRLTSATDAKDRKKDYTTSDVRVTDYRTPDDDRAQTAFDAMLAAYDATPVALERKARR
jgi:hypothetical protein